MPDVLVVDDEAPMREILAHQLRRLGHRGTFAGRAADALDLLEEADWAAVLTDVRMPDMDGMELCRRVLVRRPDVPVIVMTGYATMDTAIAAIRAGAWDFLRKPFEIDELEVALQRACSHQRLRAEVRRLRRVVGPERGPGGMIGASPAMQELFELIERIGPTPSTVLVTGPSGTGKERVARALHECSPRAEHPFVPLNCAVLPEALADNELFGHTPGAYTGAGNKARAGLFRAAEGGTVFLDEVGELSPSVQASLLRAIEERRVRPVGADHEVPVDVRLVAATNVDLAARVRAGAFREDLYYRLDVLHLRVPPLAARGDDVMLIASELLATQSRLQGRTLTWDARFEDALCAWSWPGNVRELRNVVEAASALSRDGKLSIEHLPAALVGTPVDAPNAPDPELPPLAEIEQRHVMRVMRATGGNRSQAARILGIDRKTLLARLKRYESA